MKKFIIILISVIIGLSSCKETRVFVTEDKEDVITLVGDDSLYIDLYSSGCCLSAYKLHKVGYNEWDGECLDFSMFDEEPKIVNDRIKIEHRYGNYYSITFNCTEVYYMNYVKGKGLFNGI
jgi:hypothetical protein